MVVFDLDGLLWSPELYQMDMPLRKVPASGGVSSVVVDSYGYELSLYAGARRALAELHFLPRFEGTHVAYASRTHQKKDATRAFECCEGSDMSMSSCEPFGAECMRRGRPLGT